MGCVNCTEDRTYELGDVAIQAAPRALALVQSHKEKKAHICAGTVKEKYRKLFRHQEILKDFGARSEKYTDDEFLPDPIHLNKTGNAPASFSKFLFKRATEFMNPKDIRVFNEIDPNDIRQGALGDCYLLCCLSVLAERPKLVERLIITEEFNHVGCYSIWLCDAGTWKSVIVDDYFPYNPATRLPAFTKSNGPELWVLLLEKAYAKLFGGYDIIEGGLPQYALKDLTGAPYDSRESDDPNVMWDYIKESNDKNYLLTCYSKSTEIREEKNPLGIVSGHAYGILDAKEVVTKDGSDRIVQIRNPWGKFEWTGAWGDKSPNWTPEAKAQVPTFADADDGTFWMSINDFVNYYEGVGICKLHENYFYQSKQFVHEEKPLANFRNKEDALIPYHNPNRNVIRLHVEKKTHIFLSVNQTDDRKFLVSGLPYNYSNARILVSKITPEGLRFEAGNCNNDRDVVAEATLTSGTYLVTIEIVWEQDHHKQFTLSTYSEHPVRIETVPEADFEKIEKNVVKSLAVRSAGSKVKDYAAIDEPEIKRYMGAEFGFVYFYYENKGTKALTETVYMTNRYNLRTGFPFKNNDQFEVTVSPNSDAIVVFKTVFLDGFSFNLKSNFKGANLFGGFMSDVIKAPYCDNVYIDNPEDALNDSHDIDCYNAFIKDDKDVYESKGEVKESAPEAEEEDENKDLVIQVLGKVPVRGAIVDEEGNPV